MPKYQEAGKGNINLKKALCSLAWNGHNKEPKSLVNGLKVIFISFDFSLVVRIISGEYEKIHKIQQNIIVALLLILYDSQEILRNSLSTPVFDKCRNDTRLFSPSAKA